MRFCGTWLTKSPRPGAHCLRRKAVPSMNFRRTHWRHAMYLGLLVLTGLALFLSTWRRAVGPFFSVVQWTHVAGGILYGIALVGWSRAFYPWEPGKAHHFGPGYARWGYFILVMVLVSGLGLLVGPASTRALATILHGLSSLALIIWALWHLITRLPIWKKPSGEWHISRRRALRWMVAAAVAVPVVSGVPTLTKMLTGRLLQKGRTSGALPGFVPYTVVNGFPDISEARWSLKVHGALPAKTVSFAEFQALPHREVTIDFRCVTGWVVPHVRFAGVDLLSFLESLGWDSQRDPWVTFYSGDGVYTDSLNVRQIKEYRPIMADSINNRALPVAQGHPVRLLVPNMYGYKSVKWLVAIRVGKTSPLGFWEVRGYPQNAYFGSYL